MEAKKDTPFIARRKSPYRRFDLSNPLLLGGALLVLSCASVAVFVFDLSEQPHELSEEDVGKIAGKDYRASRDFTYSRIDHESTNRIREEAANAVAPMFRWEKDVAKQAERRIRDAFSFVRSGYDAQRALRVEALKRSPAPQQLDQALMHGLALGSAGVQAEPLLLSEQLSADEWAAQWALSNREEFSARLLEYVDPSSYAVLLNERFSTAVEQDLVDLVDTVLLRLISQDRAIFASSSHIIVQRLENGEQEQWAERNLASILDIETAVQEIDSFARFRLAGRQMQLREALLSLAKQFIKPNLIFDAVATQAARDQARRGVADLLVQQTFKKGQVIVDEGHEITAEHIEYYRAMLGISSTTTWLYSALGMVLFLTLVLSLVWFWLRQEALRRRRGARDLLFLATMFLLASVFMAGGNSLLMTVVDAWQSGAGAFVVVLLPLSAGPMLLRMVMERPQYAALFAIVQSLMLGMVAELPSFAIPFALLAGLLSAVGIQQAKSRLFLFRGGLLAGSLGGVAALGLALLHLHEIQLDVLAVIFALSIGGGVLSSVFATAALPVAESLFGYTTNIKLLELANLEHPALRAMLLEAPGTYHHSMMVGSLNEAAAEAIGANAILARVGGYYHDIGKLRNAQYFAENQLCDNPHNKLKPNLSALILKTHVKDGTEVAKRYKLPQEIIDFIATHHGTSRIEFFFQKAKEQESPGIPEVREEDYRYPGPKPQSRETGICMISDMVEAAARALPEKSPARLKMLVHKLINHKFADGQFDECSLTLRDLNEIAKALLVILAAVYHQRPEYPDARKERERKNDTNPGARSDSETPEARRLIAEKRADSNTPGEPLLLPQGDGADPVAPVGRPRSARSNSGEHRKVEVGKVVEEPSAPLPIEIAASAEEAASESPTPLKQR